MPRRALLVLLLLATGAGAGEPVRLIVLETTDLHGQLQPLPPAPTLRVLRDKPAGGYAHLATHVRAIRREAADRGARVLLFDGGDIFQGTPIGNESRGDAVVECMNELAYDAGALGNHEFDYGYRNMLRLVEKADHPVLAANLTGARAVKPYVVLAPPRAPCRIAVLGLITPQTPGITTPGATRRLRFADPAPVARALLAEVEADLYFAVCHLGREEELRLAAEVDGLALVLGGHSHTPYVKRVGGTLVVQPHARGVSLARVDLDLDPDGWRVVRSEGRLVPVDPGATEPDPAVQRIVDRYARTLDAKLEEVVGTLAAPARRERGLVSSPAGNWLADVLRRAGDAEIGFMNKGGIRCDLEAGPVTYGDVYRLMPFENVVATMELEGAAVEALLERHLRVPALEWSGLLVEIERTGDGHRLVRVEVGGRPLERKRRYRVATNSFLAAGGDGFTGFRKGRRRGRGALVRDAIAADLAARTPYTPPDEARLRRRGAGAGAR